ncbi:MAG: hypothetical protein JST54_12165 [Deltaproteobacteria bacterium]|nr:hypothetical protein [Deltaproteobacteria bacterium]
MAGGPNAQTVMCMHCFERAEREGEGIEDDLYRCTVCGKRFGIDWSRGAPTTPRWPPSEEDLAMLNFIREKLGR